MNHDDKSSKIGWVVDEGRDLDFIQPHSTLILPNELEDVFFCATHANRIQNHFPFTTAVCA